MPKDVIQVMSPRPVPDGWKEYRKIATVLAIQMDVPFRVETLEGTMQGNPGDYLVMNKETEECWPVKKEIFEKTYVKVS